MKRSSGRALLTTALMGWVWTGSVNGPSLVEAQDAGPPMVVGDENQRANEAKLGETEEELSAWIEQLSEGSLTKRRKAKEALVQADARAIPLLARAALSEQRETIVYSLEVLGTLMEKSPSEETRQAARVTLQMLSESDQPSTAERAKQILGSKADADIEAFPGWDDPNSGFAGGAPGVNRSVSISNVNGLQTIRVEDGGKVTVLRDQARGKIRVSVQDGDKKSDFVVNGLADLKKKHPDVHALYEEVAGNSGGANFPPNFPGGFNGNVNGGVFSGGFGGGFRGAQAGFGVPGQMQFQNGQFQAFGGAFGDQGAPNPLGQLPPGGVPGGLPEPTDRGRAAATPGGLNPPAAGQVGPAMVIAQLEELKRRLADQPEMVQMLEQQIRALKGE